MNKIDSYAAFLIEKIGLEVSQYSETSRLGLHGRHCVEARGVWEGVEYIGLGINQSLATALTIAVAEFVEHATVRAHRLDSSSGVAAHFEDSAAISNAQTELIERDAFMTHWLLHSRGRLIQPAEFEDFLQIPEFFLSANVAFSFFDVSTVNGTYSVVCVADGLRSSIQKFGLTVGLGCHSLLGTALEKAFYEAAVNATVQLTAAAQERLDLASFLAQSNWGPTDHLRLSNTESYAELLNSKWRPQAWQINSTAAPAFQTAKLTVPDFLGECPFVVYRADACGLLQKLFFGMPRIEDVNFARLRALGWVGNESELNLLPHVLG